MSRIKGFETIARRGAFSVVKKLFIRRIAFTLAEVLIVLGIIGLIADMTIPTLVSSYRKQVAVTRLQKFYSSINQAVKLSEIDNGDHKSWIYAPTMDVSAIETWYKNYFEKYMRVAKTKKVPAEGYFYIYFSDGSALGMYSPNGSPHGWFYPSAKIKNSKSGRDRFLFLFYADNRAFTPYGFGATTREQLLDSGGGYSCSREGIYCGALIQYDGWRIADDYPVKF